MYTSKIAMFCVIFQLHLMVIHAIPSSIQMPERCRNKSKDYCMIRPGDYPQDAFESLLKAPELPVDVEDRDTNYRYGEDRGDDECDKEIYFDPVYQIIDTNDKIRYVAQIEDKFVQKMRIEECKNSGRLLRSPHIDKVILNSFNVTCTETRMEYKFLVLSSDGKSLETAYVKNGLPICCSCKY